MIIAKTQETICMLAGRIVGDRMDKIVTILIERRVKHPIYDKYVERSTKLHTHDESNQCYIGDLVTTRETRPLVEAKAWTLADIAERAVKV